LKELVMGGSLKIGGKKVTSAKEKEGRRGLSWDKKGENFFVNEDHERNRR